MFSNTNFFASPMPMPSFLKLSMYVYICSSVGNFVHSNNWRFPLSPIIVKSNFFIVVWFLIG